MEELFGYIERITFQSPETGFTVARLKEPRRSELTCIVGSMPTLQPGESVRCRGNWKAHPTYGRQFTVETYQVELPADLLGIRKYLGSGLVKGVGPIFAERIVDAFGAETLTVIDERPQELFNVPGIGKKRVDKITSCWQEQRAIREVMIFLQSVGVSPAFAQKIFKRYGAASIDKVRENPYCLARDIFGIGFKTADAIAKKMGYMPDSDARLDAGIEYVLSELADHGHVCYPKKLLLETAATMLEVEAERVAFRLEQLAMEERVVLQSLTFLGNREPFVWLRPLFLAEEGIAKEVGRLLKGRSSLRQIDATKALEWVEERLTIQLGSEQKRAIARTLSGKLSIITGGPGTGKSTITRAILEIMQKLTPHILLAAPTGRAAKRLAEVTGQKASTLHSLLEFDFKKGGFKRGRTSPLVCDLIIVDEVSMVDTSLMYSLLKAIPSHARLLLIGDTNQLPSVGPGNVLKDLIASKEIPVSQLTEIFRQAAGSLIIVNAHKINHGIFPDISNKKLSDFFFLEAKEPEEVLRLLVTLIKERLPTKYGFHPLDEIQLLTPMRRGVIGTENLNTVLQEALNPQEEYITRFGRKLGIGDKVMQIRNNYQKEVFNGDVGRVTTVDPTEQTLAVEIDGRSIPYDFSELDELVLAYAVSIHKYQGSEAPCVVLPVHTTHFQMLHRNLFYTGVTRGKKMVVLVGTKRALAIAIRNDEVKRRYTGLLEALFANRELALW